MVKSLLLRISLAPMLVTVFFGPALPLVHAALSPSSDTLGSGGIPIRSYRPDPRDTDDNGILDAYQDALDGRWSAARDAAQKAALSGGSGGSGNGNGAVLPGDDNELGEHPAAVVSGLTDAAGNPIPGVIQSPADAAPAASGSAQGALQVHTPFSPSR